MAKLKLGDLVKHWPSGPLMTVNYLRANDFVDCKWFVDDTLHTETFDSLTLTLQKEQE